jgi:transcription antitermination factor NusG
LENWFIIQVNPNCEKKAVSEIRRAGFRAYEPQQAREYRHHRTREIEIKRRPALVGYIFIRFPSGKPNWYAIRQCQGVKGVLYCDGRPYALHRKFVAAIMRQQRAMQFDTRDARTLRRAKMSGERNALTRERFQFGTRVLNSSNGIIAMVTKVTRRGTVEAITDMMGVDVPVEFTNPDDLEVIAA